MYADGGYLEETDVDSPLAPLRAAQALTYQVKKRMEDEVWASRGAASAGSGGGAAAGRRNGRGRWPRRRRGPRGGATIVSPAAAFTATASLPSPLLSAAQLDSWRRRVLAIDDFVPPARIAQVAAELRELLTGGLMVRPYRRLQPGCTTDGAAAANANLEGFSREWPGLGACREAIFNLPLALEQGLGLPMRVPRPFFLPRTQRAQATAATTIHAAATSRADHRLAIPGLGAETAVTSGAGEPTSVEEAVSERIGSNRMPQGTCRNPRKPPAVSKHGRRIATSRSSRGGWCSSSHRRWHTKSAVRRRAPCPHALDLGP